MLFPHEKDTSQRVAFRATVERLRYSDTRAEANSRKPPQPFIWRTSAADELTLIPNPRVLEDGCSTPIIGDEGGNVLDLLGTMLEQERAFLPSDRDRFQVAYRKGFTAGSVLLACYIYDSDRAPGHKSSQARGESAAVAVTRMHAKSVQNFFRDFNPVAHLWASYHISSKYKFLIAAEQGIMEYTKKVIPFYFLDEVNFERFLDIASQLAIYGTRKKTAATTLLELSNLIDLRPKTENHHPILIPDSLVDVFLKSYLPGKRDTRRMIGS
jgi:hypothetical protein